MEQNFPDNTLYELDNLDVLRGMNSETIDLIATDPPFNTRRNRSGTAGFYEDKWKWGDTRTPPDQWKWNEVHPIWLEKIKDDKPALYQVIEATRVSHADDTAAFLCFLSVRLLEMHRILKPTGSIYLHCDHTANAYIRMAMDAIFGKKNFRNEIVWCYTGPGSPRMRQFNRKHETIFWYNKGEQWTFNKEQIRLPYAQSTIERGQYDSNSPSTGPGLRDTERGKVPEDWWKYCVPEEWWDEPQDWWDEFPTGGQMSRNERTGSPDQKPLNLYKRIIKASSNEGDLILDPFCGCATTIIAARDINRRWVGIDRRQDAKYHVVCRIAGINAEERERLASQPGYEEWMQNQMARHETHYSSDPPERTDNGEPAAPTLEQVIPVTEEFALTHKEMHERLVEQFGLKCWGCRFEAPDGRYLELDHIDPKSSGGSNQLDNRALLCRPCNQKKSNRLTLTGLWTENRQDGYLQPRERPIDIRRVREWARQYMNERIRTTVHQINILGR